MHPKDHQLFKHANLLELAIQSPFWIFAYGTGFIFFLQIFAWVFYGLGWHHHPKTYPMPHVFFFDFVAESMRWIRYEAEWNKGRNDLRLLFLP
jgi:hypothetical protein